VGFFFLLLPIRPLTGALHALYLVQRFYRYKTVLLILGVGITCMCSHICPRQEVVYPQTGGVYRYIEYGTKLALRYGTHGFFTMISLISDFVYCLPRTSARIARATRLDSKWRWNSQIKCGSIGEQGLRGRGFGDNLPFPPNFSGKELPEEAYSHSLTIYLSALAPPLRHFELDQIQVMRYLHRYDTGITQ